METDVVIVGAGIGGAVLALDLGRRGYRVTVLERDLAPRRIVRPEILWNPTLNALDRFGLGKQIREQASVRLNEVDVGGLMRLRPQDFAAAGAEAFSTDPLLTRQLIMSAAQATGHVDVQRGVEVTTRLSEGPITRGVVGVRGDERLEVGAALVVGDDGVQSFIRSSLGIAINLRVFPIDFITAAVPWPSSIAHDCAKAFVNRKAFADGIPAVGLIPWPSAIGVLLIPLPPSRADRVFTNPPAQFWDALRQTVPLAAEFHRHIEFPRDFVRVTRPFGHSAAYVADGVALIGDAAHPMTPAGGQGANASIWDALALADVADGALRAGTVSRERLAPYESQRHPINARSVGISQTAMSAFRLGRRLPLATVVPLVFRTFELFTWPKRLALRRFSTAFADKCR